MAFCNSCGATLSDGAQFCNKCGAATGAKAPAAAPGPAVPPSSTGAPAAAQPSTTTTGGGSALKIVLIIVAVVVVLGILAIASLGFFAYRIAKTAKVSQNGDKVKVETPFGTVETNKDYQQAAKDLGVDIYPGAKVQTSGAASTTFGGIHTVAATFETDDSVDKVCTFYKAKFPNAMATSSTQDHCGIVSNSPPNMVTINVDAHGGGSRFQITTVMKKN